ncbi:uncharacterized protein Z520_11949 [Fonsecaea multimorphosa CBS 102226]|uniref:Amino acid permease/ SLC12A domain-containing protein n=1 Tax=Fonsecaea multimorphosa CBS 102226 TaxID=1442371 RepID=A0A0D2I524_9EURO|nr:uncharacterized protein Z520_11949 [Fonsecaea multimorphosa CBS 102226]KIX92341.1 hypothetical protein Z520_11949 [Fonsecaea multimorphosa CBS 102226]
MERAKDERAGSTTDTPTTAADGLYPTIAPKRKQFGMFAIVSLAFVICNSWAGVSGSIQLALLAGGPVTLIYSLLISGVVYLCIALSMAELASVYPTAGGQYHFTSILAPDSIRRSISYACGLVSLMSWIALGSSVTMIPAQQIPALVSTYNPGFAPHSWQIFLIYEAVALSVLIFNLFALKRNPWVHEVGFCLSIALFLISFIGILSRSRPKATSSFVWTTWINSTGWPDGICFILGLSTSCFMFIGLDAALHLAEECQDAARTVPKAVTSAIIIGFCTAFPYTISVLYGITDIQSVLTSTGYTPLKILKQCLHSADFATAITSGGIVMAFFVLNAIQETTSRLAWSFARDGGLIFSDSLEQIHPRLQVPVWSLLLTWGLLAVCGCIFMASSTGKSLPFNALVNSAIVLQQLSFLIPLALLLYRGRSAKFLPPSRAFALPRGFGMAVNVLAVLCTGVTTFFFNFPVLLPATGSNMNYTSAILGIGGILGVVNWILYARKHYRGPQIELESLAVRVGL